MSHTNSVISRIKMKFGDSGGINEENGSFSKNKRQNLGVFTLPSG